MIKKFAQLRRVADNREIRKDTDYEVWSHIERGLLALYQNGETENEAFYKHLLDRLMVFRDRQMELHLQHLPQVFHFE